MRQIQEISKAMAAGTATVVIGSQGAIAFAGLNDDQRGGMSDICAYRRLAAKNDWNLRQAVARAEMLAGRQLDQSAIAAGQHSHDGGQTWSTH